jgi:glycosyltransferase involved in cell wall biosynthesis
VDQGDASLLIVVNASAAPQFTIATPSFRSSDWLKLCIASVADQEGVTLEHIVQDAGSDDGTLDWLLKDTRVQAFVEKDSGMYDAVNRALRRARGEYFAYLNCDEQYLPSALKTVAEHFERTKDVDILFGDAVVIDQKGAYRFHRKILPATLYHTWVCHLATLTCATFVRRSFIERHGLYFNPNLKDGGDAEWMVRALKCGAKTAAIGTFVSTFGDTGANMSTKPNAMRERRELDLTAPKWVQRLRTVWIASHRLRRAAAGVYAQAPFQYSVFTPEHLDQRVTFRAEHPTFRWRLQNTS